MCKKYFISIKPGTGGYNMIHHEECPFLPEEHKRIFLGNFNSLYDASIAGTKYFRKSYRCPFCSKGHIKAGTGIADPLLNIITGTVSFYHIAPTWESVLMCGVN
jgi:hypothetical protein